ncbi:MAG: hypothetical protein J6U23_12430 [Clostridiales bacterium]|nr:hypothetical protein [Clostridiales bacterium]
MRKTVSIMLSLVLVFLSACSVFLDQADRYDNMQQKYYEGYEDIQRQIVEKYGNQVYVGIGKGGNSVGVILHIKGSYYRDEETQTHTPFYMIVEDSRVMINNYLEGNPSSQLSTDMKNSDVYLEMMYEGEHIYFLFKVKSSDERLVIYEDVADSDLDNMYDYIAKSGDVKWIKIIDKYGLSDEEQEKWREEVRSKFPLMAATSE